MAMTVVLTDEDFEEAAWAIMAEMSVPASPELLFHCKQRARETEQGRLVAALFHLQMNLETT